MRKAKILVVEDHDAVREEIALLLDLEGFDVVQCSNGAEGLEQARAVHPDLVLSDLMMPEMSGYELVERLRLDPALATVPFIFLTARADQADQRAGMVHGADDYLTKPFAASDLLRAVEAGLAKQRRVEARTAQEADRLREQISAMLPHELNTPLAAILGWADLLRNEASAIEPEQIAAIAETIHSSADRLRRLTENFLLYAQLTALERRDQAVRPQRANGSRSRTALAGAVARSCARTAEREQDLVVDISDAPVAVAEDHFRKIVEELVDNAFRYSEHGTRVSVVARADGHRVEIEVADQGRGMTSEEVDTIAAFTQFRREHFEQQGSGLGLAVAGHLVKLSDGALTVDGHVGQGVVVSVTLPRAPSDRPTADDEGTEPHPPQPSA